MLFSWRDFLKSISVVQSPVENTQPWLQEKWWGEMIIILLLENQPKLQMLLMLGP